MIRLLASFALVAALFAGPVMAEQPRDVFGRPVPMGEGRPTLVFFSNEGTREVMQKHVYDLSWQLRDEEPVVVVHVDLRGVPGMFKGTARREVRKAHRESVEIMERYMRQQGMEPEPGQVHRSLYMIPDFAGAAHASHGLRKGFRTVFAQAHDRTGELLTTARFPDQAARLTQAVESAHQRLTRR